MSLFENNHHLLRQTDRACQMAYVTALFQSLFSSQKNLAKLTLLTMEIADGFYTQYN
jgi:hypothetical protein